MYTKVKIRKRRYTFFNESTELLYIKYKKTFNASPQEDISEPIIENVNPIVIVDLTDLSVYSNAVHPNINTVPVFYAFKSIFSEVCVGTYYRDINAAISLKKYDAIENIFDEYLSQYNDNGYWYPDSNLVTCPTCKRKVKLRREKTCGGCYYSLKSNGRDIYSSDIDNFNNYSISYRNNSGEVNIILTRKKEKKNENV